MRTALGARMRNGASQSNSKVTSVLVARSKQVIWAHSASFEGVVSILATLVNWLTLWAQ